jgi:hypothetical protein
MKFYFPNLEIMKHFRSIFLDLNSWKVIKERNWHKYIPNRTGDVVKVVH